MWQGFTRNSARIGAVQKLSVPHNGFVVIGVSGCLNPADFDETIGRDEAYKDAFAKLWQLQGYHLKTLFAESETHS